MGRGWRHSLDEVVRNGQFDDSLGVAGGRKDPENNERVVADHDFNDLILCQLVGRTIDLQSYLRRFVSAGRL